MCKIPTSINLQDSECLKKCHTAIEELKPQLPSYHTMRRQFAKQCSNLTSITPAARRFLYSSLTGDSSAPPTSEVRDIEYRMQMVVLGELPEVAADLRHLNDGKPALYDIFLSIVQDMIRDYTAEDDRRQGTAHLSHFISVHDLHKMASDKCPSGTAIPSLDWLRLQFQPKSARAYAALRYTGKLDIRYALQIQQLRAAHPDDHYCAALFKMQRAMAVELRNHSNFVCLDDKAKIPIGEPNTPMSTGVRGTASLMAAGSTPRALDHDQASKGSLTPSVILQCDIPSSPDGSFYRGQLHVLVKDSVLQPPTPLRHGAELSQLLKTSSKPVLFPFTDGGGDHRCTFRSVQLSWILLFFELDLDLLIACRTAPGHSYINPAECCMATLNLALQNCALARQQQDTAAEKSFKACNGMEAIRKLQPAVQGAWTLSVKPVQKAIERRFNRLMYTDRQVLIEMPAAAEDIVKFLKEATKVDPSIDITNVAPKQSELKSKEKLDRFLDTHCRQRHYSFQIKKCGEDVCPLGLCHPPKLPSEIFSSLSWLPDPIVDQANQDHYLRYEAVKGQDTTDDMRPSLQEKSGSTETQGCDGSMFTAQRVRSAIQCSECLKPRCLYSKTSLSSGQLNQLSTELEQCEYSCGSPLLPPESSLHAMVFVRLALQCSDPVEFSYYSSKLPLHGVCCHCGCNEASKPQEYLQKYHTILPICTDCQKRREVVTRMPKAGSKRKHPAQE